MRKALSWCWAWTFRRRPRRSLALWFLRPPMLWLPPQISLRIPGRILSEECNGVCAFHFYQLLFMCNYFTSIHTRDIFPEGLPPSYVFVATLRLKGSSSKLTFDLWRVLSKDKVIQAAVTLSGKEKTVIFTTTSTKEKEQRVVFKEGFQVSIWVTFPVSTRWTH